MKKSEEKISDVQERKRRIRERYKGEDAGRIDLIPAKERETLNREDIFRRVAVYARVSTDDPNQTSSYELQKNHYTDFVSEHPNWELVGIYADEGISGTSLAHRDQFNAMVGDCEAGKIDMVITKSVSRFARNIVDCIKIERDLKKMNPPVGVFFEAENIYTLDDDCEVMLSIMAMMAQEESHTKSETMDISIEMRFRKGIFLTPALFGYDKDEDGNLVVNEDEAKIVRLIFYMYLDGYTCQEIADTLTDFGQSTKKGNTVWSSGTILQILQNERHCGDVRARKTWTPNYLDHKARKNRQDKNQYYEKDHHEAIISRDDFIAVQRLISNAKYGNRGFLPELRVIPDGMLRGYVSVHPKWAGFKPSDYFEACDSAGGRDEDSSGAGKNVEAFSGEFDLRGYEVARSQFFETGGITVTFSPSRVTFSTGAVRKFEGDDYIELLLHPRRRMIAVRPCGSECRNRMQWSRTCGGARVPKKICGSAFLPSFYETLGWNTEYGYRITGRFFEKGGSALLLFDLRDMEVLIPEGLINGDGTQGSGRMVAYPGDWTESFGNDYYEQAESDEFSASEKDGDWNADAGGRPYKEPDLHPTGTEERRGTIASLIGEMKRGSEDGR